MSKQPTLVTIMWTDEHDAYHCVTFKGWRSVVRFATPLAPAPKRRRRPRKPNKPALRLVEGLRKEAAQ